jgi:hypothetical protein
MSEKTRRMLPADIAKTQPMEFFDPFFSLIVI